VDLFNEFPIKPLNEPDGDTLLATMRSQVSDAAANFGGHFNAEGEWQPAGKPSPPIPPLVRHAKSLKPFVELRNQLQLGEFNSAWIAWEELRKLEPDCGRGALLAMEVFRSLAARQGTEELTEEMRERCIRTAIEGLKHSPNDVMLRGTLAWNAFILHARTDWALAALKQALTIDPGHPKLLEWHALIEHYWNPDRTLQARWIQKQVDGKPTDGRVELILGNLYFNSQRYAEGVEWYLKGIKLAPLEHELHFSLALCGTYGGEQLKKRDLPGEAGAADRAKADELFTLASDHMWEAISLDPLEIDYAYDFYLRSVTHSHTVLPSRLIDIDRVFLVWAARDGMASTSRTGKLDRVTAPLIRDARIDARKAAKAAKPGDPHFAMQAMARLHFAAADDDKDEIIESLRVMKHQGLRPDVYHGYMRTYGPLVK
jgi:tetratricopeptide (TPR) repeat protein